MCLNLPKNYKKRIAEKDIICYKHVMVLTFNDGVPDELVTSYQVTKVEIGKSYTSEIYISDKSNISDSTYITEALHSYKTKNACIADVKTLSNADYAICRCVIPEGSEYYIGRFGNAISYASNAIYYKEILKVINVCRYSIY